MRVGDVMTAEVVALEPGMTLREAAETLRGHGISGAPVVERGDLVGVLSEGDVVKALRTGELGYGLWFPSPFELVEVPLRNLIRWRKLRDELEESGDLYVGDVMTESVKTASPNDTVEDAAETMTRHRINRLPVLRGGEVVGIVTREDIIRGLVG
ncbi:MAG: hypothetical protein MAG715_00367 [Methanonatronarchaeales archaeon]|nr:hypothetical protein [Methanonatronarchaeales archaeon]